MSIERLKSAVLNGQKSMTKKATKGLTAKQVKSRFYKFSQAQQWLFRRLEEQNNPVEVDEIGYPIMTVTKHLKNGKL